MRPAFALSAMLALLAMLAGCSEAPADVTVTMKDDRFVGGDRAVRSGQVIEFQNQDVASHTVTIHKVGDPDQSRVKSSVVNAGGDTRFQVPGPGTYKVYCEYHGSMDRGMSMELTAA